MNFLRRHENTRNTALEDFQTYFLSLFLREYFWVFFFDYLLFLSSNNDLEFSKCNFCSISCFKIQIKKNSSNQQVNKFLKNSDPMISFDVYSIIHERKNAFGKWNGRGKNIAEKIVHWYVKSQFLSPTQYKTQTFLPFRIFLSSSLFCCAKEGSIDDHVAVNSCYISYSLWTSTMEESFPLLRKFLVSYLASIDAVFIHRCSLTPISNTTRLCVTRYEKILIWACIWESMYPISVYSVWIIYAYETSNTRNFHEEFMEFFRIIVHTEGWRDGECEGKKDM